MLYSDFLKGVGCRDTKNNYKIFSDLEILYVNSDLTEEQIYAYGKRLVNTALTREEREINAKIEKDICDTHILLHNAEIDLEKYNADFRHYTTLGLVDDESIRFWKKEIRITRKKIREYKELIKDLEQCKYK